MQYRPEVDGLRTFAILPVVVYHLKIPIGSGYLMPGGFLGVDVFFVISGYLIASILFREIAETGKISIRRFYRRRARRILPGLLLVIFTTLAAGWIVLLPSELDRLALSTIAALTFLSNVFWYFELGTYGAQSGLLQPLLHTWSLAIEEQFYVFFPLFLLFLRPMQRPRVALCVVSGLSLLGLFVSQVTTLLAPELSFFSPVSRVWELLFGVLVALIRLHSSTLLRNGPALKWLLPKLAMLTLAVSIFVVDLPEAVHPGLATVPTVLATGMLIAYASKDEIVTRLLAFGPIVYVGKLSYSIYLWHFPVFALGRLLNVGPPDAVTMLAWVSLTLSLSVCAYHFVERPFRFGVSDYRCSRILAGCLIAWFPLVVAISVTDLTKRGRILDLATMYGPNEIDNDVLRIKSWGWLDEMAGTEERITTANALKPSLHERERLWFVSDERIKLLLVGNSHSKDLFNTLYSSDIVQQEFALARFGIAADFPEEQLEQLYSSPNFDAADWLVITSRFGQDYESQLPALIEDLKTRGKNVALAGNPPEFDWAGPLPIFDWFVRTYGATADLEEMNTIAWSARAQRFIDVNGKLRRIAEDSAVPYLSRTDLVCNTSESSCTLVTPDGLKTMYDREHWTLEGATYFGARAVEHGWLSELRQ